MNQPYTKITDERLAELLLVAPLGDITAALLELQHTREFFADLAELQMTLCPHCIRVFESDANRKTLAALRVARVAVNYIRHDPQGADRVARQAVMLAAAQIGLE